MVVYSNMRNIKPVLTIGVSFNGKLKKVHEVAIKALKQWQLDIEEELERNRSFPDIDHQDPDLEDAPVPSVFGEPIDLAEESKAGGRGLSSLLTDRFEEQVQTGLDSLNLKNDCPGSEPFVPDQK